MSEEKKGLFARLKEGLTKTRDNIVRGIDSVFSGFSAIDDEFYEELEEILVMGDIGINATTEIIGRLKQQVKEQHIKEPADCKQLLVNSIKEQMHVEEAAYDFEHKQSIVMVIGVNGVGKTTSVGKLAGKWKGQGRKVLIAAADTFRAAAGDQLAEWARRADVPMIGGKEGADPASVVYDAVNAAKARGVDILLIDTAGRLHNKKNLMEELRKMNRIIDREFPDAHRENLIVLDGTTGQNALVQAREFGDVAELTGIILTKMDGTAKGGIAVAIQSELNVPVKYIGVGETIDDLQKFNPDDFVNALFDISADGTEASEPDAEKADAEKADAAESGAVKADDTTAVGREAAGADLNSAVAAAGAAEPDAVKADDATVVGLEATGADLNSAVATAGTAEADAAETEAAETEAAETEATEVDAAETEAAEPEKPKKLSFWKRLWS